MADGSAEEEGGVADLLAVMARLRDPQRGCPWDLQQTFATIAPYTIEEAYEVADAIDRGALDDLRDELGDLLLQVVFHARMAEEAGVFGFADVVRGIREKLVRRHPHVFADAPAGDVSASWEAIKRDERAARGDDDRSALAGVARGLPEWQRALKLQARAARSGFEWSGPAAIIAKLHEEIDEVRTEFAARAAAPDDAAARDRLEDELGDMLFVATGLARHAQVDPGRALRRANAKFERRFRRMEALAAADGLDFAALDADAQERLWARTKAEEQASA